MALNSLTLHLVSLSHPVCSIFLYYAWKAEFCLSCLQFAFLAVLFTASHWSCLPSSCCPLFLISFKLLCLIIRYPLSHLFSRGVSFSLNNLYSKGRSLKLGTNFFYTISTFSILFEALYTDIRLPLFASFLQSYIFQSVCLSLYGGTSKLGTCLVPL